jgi:hypothetical protein
MLNGRVVLVTTEPLAGGSAVRSVYFVAEGDPHQAPGVERASAAAFEDILDRERLAPQPAALCVSCFQRGFVCGQNRVRVDCENRKSLFDDRGGQGQHSLQMIEALDIHMAARFEEPRRDASALPERNVRVIRLQSEYQK